MLKFVDRCLPVYSVLEVERDLIFESREKLKDALAFHHTNVDICFTDSLFLFSFLYSMF